MPNTIWKREEKNAICNKWRFIAYTWHRNQPLRIEQTEAFQLQIVFLFKLQMNCFRCASTVRWLYVSNACYKAIIHSIVGFESSNAVWVCKRLNCISNVFNLSRFHCSERVKVVHRQRRLLNSYRLVHCHSVNWYQLHLREETII